MLKVNFKIVWGIFLSMLSMTSILVFAENSKLDDSFPLTVQSDSLNVNYATQQGLYIGNVVADQGTRHLTADHVLLVRDPDLKEFSEMHAFGNVSHEAYIQLIPKPGDSLVKGNADEIIYHPISHILTFKGHAEIEQEGRVYKGPLAIYNIETEIFDSPEIPDGRVTMIIPPEKSV
jgi:lipopolysaccharide export system protein LptA